jgi:cysteine sulfinate desulfinase/cysteine desulfurase-like protein
MPIAPPRPNRPVYLDNQATTRCDPRVVEAMQPWFTEHYGNPHSVEHVMGSEAEAVLRALGLSNDAASRTLRIGIGRFTSTADIDYAAAALAAAHAGVPASGIEHLAKA